MSLHKYKETTNSVSSAITAESVYGTGKVKFLSAPPPKPVWWDEIKDNAESLINLKDNWDTYYSSKINPNTVLQSLYYLKDNFNDFPSPKPLIVPVNDGGVQYEWHTEKLDLEIRFTSDKEVLVYYCDLDTDQDQEFPLTNIKDIYSILVQLAV